MSVFDPIELKWNGQKYNIPSDKVMGCIARIEDVITLPELDAYRQKEGMPMAKLSMAYAAVLRYAGASVSDDEVYAKMFQNDETQETILEGILDLLMKIIPPGATEEEQPEAPLSKPAKKNNSSGKRTKPASGKAG